MILSASYRSDIPAFHNAWFLQQLAAGSVAVKNPYSGKVHQQSLAAEHVDGWVFWTRNAAPFLPSLRRLSERGDPFVVQYSLTAYPRALEERVPGMADSIDRMRHLAETYGPEVVVWRYDPILITSLTPFSYHRRQFRNLAAALAGISNEVVVSFAAIYRKTRRNLERAANLHQFTWHDPPLDEKQACIETLSDIAGAHGLRLSLCSQPELNGPAAACISAERLSRIAQKPIQARTKGNRPGCLCAESRDIGAYDSCGHGCMYCYAVGNHARARQKLKARALSAAS